jgi:hypothetical protein
MLFDRHDADHRTEELLWISVRRVVTMATAWLESNAIRRTDFCEVPPELRISAADRRRAYRIVPD